MIRTTELTKSSNGRVKSNEAGQDSKDAAGDLGSVVVSGSGTDKEEQRSKAKDELDRTREGWRVRIADCS